jgi:teichoic acid transport system permease protein
MNWKFYQQQYSNFLHTQRRQGGFWVMWLVVMPLVPVIAYALLGVLKLLPSDGQIPRYLFIMIGMTLWLLLSDALMRPANSVARYKGYFIRQEIGFFALLTAWLPERMLALLLQVTLCISLVVYEVGMTVTSTAAFLLLMSLGFVLFHILGIIVAIISLIYPNFNNLITTINRFMLFVSGVLFPLPDGEITRYLQLINPYYVFIDSARSSLFGMQVEWPIVGVWGLVLIVFCVTLIKILQKVSPSIREFLQ